MVTVREALVRHNVHVLETVDFSEVAFHLAPVSKGSFVRVDEKDRLR